MEHERDTRSHQVQRFHGRHGIQARPMELRYMLQLERLQMNCDTVMHHVKNQDWDYLMILDGEERSGKTTLGCHVLRFQQPELERDIQCGIYEPFLSHCVWSFEDATSAYAKVEKGSSMFFNEARILGRRAMKELNLRVIDVLTTMGNLNIAQTWTFPDFHMLDPYLRQRARCRGFVFTSQAVRG